jgi:DNA-binding transcriptional MocR family regulator
MDLALDRSRPLSHQIHEGFRGLIERGALRPGARLPSVRGAARDLGVSTFTVVEAYDRLLAENLVRSVRGSGFFVADRRPQEPVRPPTPGYRDKLDALWLVRALESARPRILSASGLLPRGWQDEEAVARSLRKVARTAGEALTDYGSPFGYVPLRKLLAAQLGEVGIGADPDQVVLTHGVSQGIDLICRLLLKPGDTVLVESPAYYIQFGHLQRLGLNLVPVPRTPSGPDLEVLARLAAEHRPRALFLNSVLQNPTGSSLNLETAHRVLSLAEQHDFLVVEDDINGDFHPGSPVRVASLDQLKRVIYLGSFSKTVTAAVRVGYVACSREVARDLADFKMVVGLSTSEINERAIHDLLSEGGYRKHRERLRQRLYEERTSLSRRITDLGFRLFCEPAGGCLLWAELPGGLDSGRVTLAAADRGLLLAPGSIFDPELKESGWLRFNAAYAGQPGFDRILTEAMAVA